MESKSATTPQPKEETSTPAEVTDDVSGENDNKLKDAFAVSSEELHPQRIKYRDDDETRFLLGRKLDYVNTLAHLAMTWWVSSLVFCGSIFAAVWIERDKLVNGGIFCQLGNFLSLFFAGLVVFGAQITWRYLPRLRKDLSSLPKKPNGEDFFSTELSTFFWSMAVGTISFLCILIGWILFWRRFATCRWW